MNERMEDLMYEAGLTAQGCWDDMGDYDHKAIEKFAELIVIDCAGIAYNNIDNTDDAVKISGLILNTLGVK